MNVKDLTPLDLWKNFILINKTPRGTYHSKLITDFIYQFGKELSLETLRDSIGNVIIKKDATPDQQSKQTVILQSHLDMVHHKDPGIIFDFATQGIPMFVDGGWVKARGTTLGADNGIGVAAILSILSSDTISHPKIEALFTIDEEMGMTGAKQLDATLLKGSILLNLDTDDESIITIGCAGACNTITELNYINVAVSDGFQSFMINIDGLVGGHSGLDINKGRANANKIMSRILYRASHNFDIKLASFKGGGARNVIPSESECLVVVPAHQENDFLNFLKDFKNLLIQEYLGVEHEFSIRWERTEKPPFVLSSTDFNNIIGAIYSVVDGVFRMSTYSPGLVETSTNLAMIIIKDGLFTTHSMHRSLVISTLDDVCHSVRSTFKNIGCSTTQTGEYPIWNANLKSNILNVLLKVYGNHFEGRPQILSCHAGLECGILASHLKNVDMVSIGPTILDAHSSKERVNIASVNKFFSFLLEILQSIPEKRLGSIK